MVISRYIVVVVDIDSSLECLHPPIPFRHFFPSVCRQTLVYPSNTTWSSSVSASLISQSTSVTVFPTDTSAAQSLFSTLPQVFHFRNALFRALNWLILLLSGSVSSPSYGLKDRSTNDGYHHTDCLWIASVKPTEIWVATIFTPHQGSRSDYTCHLVNALNVISNVKCQETVKNGMSHCISTTINGQTSWALSLMSSALT